MYLTIKNIHISFHYSMTSANYPTKSITHHWIRAALYYLCPKPSQVFSLLVSKQHPSQ